MSLEYILYEKLNCRIVCVIFLPGNFYLKTYPYFILRNKPQNAI